ncbi:MAG: C-GCAxxG-C-C family protein [Oscillospiraceae bacterium]|nr:C-GCAxxG-C-C family protein [Oscillospiraceae bacterium]
MNKYIEKAQALRSDPAVHYNCAQSVVMCFAAECGLSDEQARLLTAHFGSGMKMGEMCGTITGGLMVIGMLGGGDAEYRAFTAGIKERHNGLVRCADLLRENVHSPSEKKPHCDGLVYEAVQAVAELMHLV